VYLRHLQAAAKVRRSDGLLNYPVPAPDSWRGKNDLKEFADFLMHPEALYGIVSFMDRSEESGEKATLEKLANSEWMNLFWLNAIKGKLLRSTRRES